jgi:hypothetical protein
MPPHLRRAALACALPLSLAAGTAQAQSATPFGAGGGKLLLTGGVSSIDGAAGGGLTPWAVTGSYATEGQTGATAHMTRVVTQKYALTAYGAALAVKDRFELSLARQEFNTNVVVPDTTLKLDIVGIKLKLAGDAVLDSDSLMPQIAVGAQLKHLDPGPAVGGVLDSVQAKRSGVDMYASATKLFLAQGVLVNATLRATKANQNGLLGFASTDKKGYSLQPEFSAAWLLRKNLAIGAEYRAKPDNLNPSPLGEGLAEDDWADLFVAWAPSKHLSLTLALVDLGHIVPAVVSRRQTGAYLSAQVAY